MTEMYAPTTRGGRWLSDVLASRPADVEQVGISFLAKRVTELVSQVFVVAMRRAFPAGYEDASSAVTYVTGVVGDRAAAVSLCRVAFVDGIAGRASASDLYHVVQVVLDLVPDAYHSRHDINSLVRAAELRVWRAHKNQLARSAWWYRPLARRRLRRHAITVADVSATGPRTPTGLKLRAHAQFDPERLARLPSEPSDARGTFVTREACRMLLRRRFPDGVSSNNIATFADRVASYSSRQPVQIDDIITAIRYDVGNADRPGALSPETLLRVRIATIVCLVDTMALFEAELDAILREAEVAVGNQFD